MKTHPAVQCVEDHRDADKVVGRIGGQVLPELANVGVYLRHPAINHALGSPNKLMQEATRLVI